MSTRTNKHPASTLTSRAPLNVSWDNEYFEHVTKTGRATEKIKIHLSIQRRKRGKSQIPEDKKTLVVFRDRA